MPSNTSKGIGTKGSKLWMGLYANCESFRKTCDIKFYKFNKDNNLYEITDDKNKPYICEQNDIQFISPLEENNYEEYKFNQIDKSDYSFLPSKKDIIGKWPSRAQGQYDGIAVDQYNKDSNIKPSELYLFEAKAHKEEIETENAAKFNKKNDTDRKKIVNIIKKHFYIDYKFNGSKLREKESIYYQTINRLCFLYNLEELKKSGKIKFEPKLIFLNFYNDKTLEKKGTTYIKDMKSMITEYEKVWKNIRPIDETKLKNVYIAFVNVEKQSELLSLYTKGIEQKIKSLWDDIK